jgi:hypothetical protein
LFEPADRIVGGRLRKPAIYARSCVQAFFRIEIADENAPISRNKYFVAHFAHLHHAISSSRWRRTGRGRCGRGAALKLHAPLGHLLRARVHRPASLDHSRPDWMHCELCTARGLAADRLLPLAHDRVVRPTALRGHLLLRLLHRDLSIPLQRYDAAVRRPLHDARGTARTDQHDHEPEHTRADHLALLKMTGVSTAPARGRGTPDAASITREG